MKLNDKYEIITDRQYVIKKGDICSIVEHNDWTPCFSTIGKTIAYLLKTRPDLEFAKLKIQLKENKVIPPEGFELVNFDDYTVLLYGQKFLQRGFDQWIPVTGYTGLRIGIVRKHHGDDIINLAIKSDKPVLPRFPTNKPYPYGY